MLFYCFCLINRIMQMRNKRERERER